MLDLEQLGASAMEIIAYAGVAKSNYVEAAHLARAYQFEDAMKKIDEGDAVLKNAHDAHLVLLQKEAQDNTPQVSMLVLHAEDQFMSSETMKLLALEIIEVYRKLQNLEKAA
ncbi:PTS lactose/cellobiose transporter subunit IIA [Merdibacter massiliensis]|uniref:PTS lactose/cellobiose transporter subunit IIA n=1 Tax=Merdibacter massiliensis TaxID=1871030 RepID=UPI00096A2664|nr:PTS lactose/cellobiose transporter subunit IIA [Merdibacter massiliensis]